MYKDIRIMVNCEWDCEKIRVVMVVMVVKNHNHHNILPYLICLTILAIYFPIISNSRFTTVPTLNS